MKYLYTLMTFLAIISCVHGHDHRDQPQQHAHDHQNHQDEEHPISETVTIGKQLAASRYSDIYFSAQPSIDDFKMLKNQGFAAVVNLRETQEEDYQEMDEKVAVEKLGLHYIHTPMGKGTPLTDAQVNKITQAVVRHRKHGKILVHCSSGNRVGIWLGGHFHKDHGLAKKESLKLAKKLGLKNPGAVKIVEKYFFEVQ